MAEWLTIKQMSEKYGIDESSLHEWSNLGYITSSVTGDGMRLDDESLVRYLDEHKETGLSEDALIRLVKERELQRENTLSQLKDELFRLKTHSCHPAIFHTLIQELDACIIDERQRGIFLAIAGGEPISRVASRYGMSYDTTVIAYNSTVKKLGKNPTRIATLRHYATNEQRPVDLCSPMEIRLIDVFTYHIWNILYKGKKMRTLYDLLEFTTQHEWLKLLEIPGMGKSTYEFIIRMLKEKGYITVREDDVIEIAPKLQAYIKK